MPSTPDWKAYVRSRLVDLRLPGPREAEIVEELAQHLQASYEDARASGSSHEEALERVEALFPDWSALERELRRAERASGATDGARSPAGKESLFGSLWHDVRFGGRGLAKTPAFTIISLLTLAVGIGANAVIFSIVDGVLLRPLPYRDSERLALIRVDVEGESAIASLSAIELLDFRQRAQLFEEFAGVWSSSAALTGLETPEQIRYAWATRNLHSMLGVEPMLGRSFTDEEEAPNGPAVVLLSAELWRRRFGAEADVIGRPIEIDDRSYEVVGVLPPGFRLLLGADTDVSSEIEAWVPQTYWINRKMRWLRVIGRLRAGVTIEQAQEEMDAIAESLQREYADYDKHELAFHVVPLHGDLVRGVKPAVLALFGAVGFVLLIACTNVANLLLTKTKARSKELAIRAALGAGRARVVRQILTESALLALAGGILGVVLAKLCLSLLPLYAPLTLPRLDEVVLDGRVIAFTLAASLVTSVVFGLLPALQGTRLRLHDTLKEGGRSGTGTFGSSLRGTLAVAEIALSFVLLMGAGLMIQTLFHLEGEDLGYDSESVLTMQIPISMSEYGTGESQWSFYRALEERVEAEPGVSRTGAVSLLPLGGGLFTSPYAFDAESERDFGARSADYRTVVPGFFETMRARMVEGDAFSAADSLSGRRVVVIDETLAETAWPGENAVGKRVKVDLQAGVAESQPEWMDVVGVVRHLRHDHVKEDGRPQIYFPIWLRPVSRMSLVVRTDGEPEVIAASVRHAVKELGSHRPVHTIRTMDGYVDDAMAGHRFTVTLMLAFAGVALLLAVVGIYGVISFSVSQRAHELGIRVALGASTPDVLLMVLRQGAVLALAGTVLGMVGAAALSRSLESLVFGVTTKDPATFTAVAVILPGVSLLACARPAWRGTRVDPTVALRRD